MRKRSLVALAASLVACALTPTIAQATKVQVEGKEAANFTMYSAQGQSVGSILNAAKEQIGEVHCSETEFYGSTGKNNEETIHASVESARGVKCVTNGSLVTHVTSNASAAAVWQFEAQQPAADKTLIAHLQPAAGKELEYTAVVQMAGTTIATCTYASKGIQMTGLEGEETLISALQPFVKKAGGVFCGAEMVLSAEVRMEDLNKKPIVFDMK